MFAVRNNTTGDEYLLLGSVAIQEDRYSGLAVSSPLYTHGVLLYHARKGKIIAVPYSVLLDEVDSNGDQIPAWELAGTTDCGWPNLEADRFDSAMTDATILRIWKDKARERTPMQAGEVYQNIKDSRNFVRLPAERFDSMADDGQFMVSLICLDVNDGSVAGSTKVSLDYFLDNYAIVNSIERMKDMADCDQLFSLSEDPYADIRENPDRVFDTADMIERIRGQNVTETSMGLVPYGVYLCGKDKREYTYIGLLPEEMTTTGEDGVRIALFITDAKDTTFPVVGIPVDTRRVSGMRVYLFEQKTDYGDGIKRPYLAYIGQSEAKVCVKTSEVE